ncbi:MBL fold metallo-hydrolase [uncultured Caulobacter sp.]|uniref:MBL fold metallo-hydrolase n=1 Tax=uncultured Caulobacter sp. TaxID=158749 RepID=UPI00260A83C6|nr:MBL fold metallo-hydrolase [uncultured Caulobacter sp.]
MRKVWIGLGTVVGLLVVGLGLAWLFRDRIALVGMRKAYEQILASDPVAELPDGLHVGLCGSGSPMADPTRAGPCVVVVAGKDEFVVDSGPGSTRNLLLMNLPPPRVSAAFITHYHSDHIGDLGELMLQRWAGGAAKTPLPIYGPQGLDGVVKGFEAAYQLDRGYRIAHHGEKVVPPSGFGGAPHAFTADPDGQDVLVLEKPGLKVFAFPVMHHPVEGAVGYRFEYKGRSVVISGDTGPSERLVRAAKNVDLLVHEGLAPNLVAVQQDVATKAGKTNYAHIFHDILTYHTAPETAAREAKTAGVKAVLFYHIIPPLPVRALEGPFLGRSREIFGGPMRVGHDGDFVSLPVGSKAMHWSDRLALLKL